jgi:hypothetical protein
LQQPRNAAHCTFGAETAHDLALAASGLSGHLAQAASIPEPRRTRRMALRVPPYLRRRKLTVRAFGTEGQHCSVGLFLHNKNSHNLRSISVSVKSPLQSFPRLAEAARELKPTARPDVVKASEGHFPQHHHGPRRLGTCNCYDPRRLQDDCGCLPPCVPATGMGHDIGRPRRLVVKTDKF